ncbi:hypothetical protein F2Q69_00037565 [Brassica cretica]|uniref:Uncharacterized protein n=1 Tax=Brassica cretica TaxID=69181 RepID=A0A8S9SV14_BRACR|nr:hypothetical protein F2Q69_00037565 [Brassica cretica]
MKLELVLIPSTGDGHLRPLVEVAKLLLDNDDHLSITVIIIPSMHGFQTTSYSSYIASLSTTSNDRLRFSFISSADRPNSPDAEPNFISYMESYKPVVKATVAKLTDYAQPPSSRLAGFVMDIFCTTMIDVANDFGVPTYLFYPSNATFFGLQIHVQYLCDVEKCDIISELKDSETELEVPCLTRSLPAKCFPSVLLNKEWLPVFLRQARRFRETKEQQLNAFEMVEELGLGVEIRNHFQGVYMAAETDMELMTAEEIERGVRCLMEKDSDVRDRVRKMSEKSHMAVMDGGSSHAALVKFIQEVTRNIS